jgi:putative salt-induced outer membrane protein
MNQFTADLAANYGRAADATTGTLRTTVKNFQGRLRYDRYLSDRWALFLQQSGRNDKFQGLSLRFNFDPGAAYYIIQQEKQHLSVELGYDLQYDIRTDEALASSTAQADNLSATEVRHNARLYGGYDNAINEHITFQTGLEYLQAFKNTENFRINWISSLTSSFTESFSLAAGFTLRYDNNPLPGVVALDTITTLSLVYTMQ